MKANATKKRILREHEHIRDLQKRTVDYAVAFILRTPRVVEGLAKGVFK